jgi:2-polyprenyl-6-methoxyphenol hydroxylase-like FAD-dependent oxidoreductase
MDETFDVIVVGARCAGAPLATLLSRRGLRVALVERATFPRDTLSTHIFQAPGINLLARLGLLERVRGTGAPCIQRVIFRQNDFETTATFSMRPGDRGGFMSVRRFLLDSILADAAGDAGAEVMMGTSVSHVVSRDGRVCGVRVSANGVERQLSARIVVGADGRNSTVAKLVGARKYHVVPSERFAYWGFFELSDGGREPELVFHHWAGRVVTACPADSGLYQVILVPDNRFRPDFRADLQKAFMDHARACAPVAERLDGATRVGKLFGITRFESYFRESAGPGWVLVGDAGQFKDPTPGQGMTDAFRQAAALAPVIAGAIGDSDARLDRAAAEWARWRDRDAFEHHWLACDLGAAGSIPAVISETMRRIERSGRFDRLIDIFAHRALPSRVLTPPQLLATTAAMLVRRGCDRRTLVRDFAQLVVTDTWRKQLRRRPVYVDAAAHADAGETEVPYELAA